MAGLCPVHQLAWDCGSGNGQCALPLTKFFDQVVANDPSERQLALANQHPRITYHVAVAEDIEFSPGTVDLITVAQAIHWFDFPRFYEVVNRVLKPEGIIAVLGYGLLTITLEIDKVIRFLYDDLLGPYWLPEREMIDRVYQTIPFPFEEVNAPTFFITTEWTFHELVGYLNTWSSTRRYINLNGRNPIWQIEPRLKAAWGNESRKRSIRFPMFLRIGKIKL